MPISRLLLFVAIGFIIWLVWRSFTRRIEQNKPTSKEHVDSMVRCEFCGTHLPPSSAIKKNGRYYCCEEHSNKVR